MKHAFLALLILSAASAAADDIAAPTSAVIPAVVDARSRWAIGIDVDGLGTDWGTGLMINTPSILNFASLSVAGKLYQYTQTNSDDLEYGDIIFSMLAHEPVTDAFEIYTRAGVGILIPEKALASSNNTNFEGAIGFELLNYSPLWAEGLLHRISIFGEVGVSFPLGNAHADQLPGTPNYANGAVTSFGIRMYL